MQENNSEVTPTGFYQTSIRPKLVSIKNKGLFLKENYPKLFWTTAITTIGGFLLIFALFLFILLTYLGVFGKIPSYPEIKNIQNNTASQVYSEDGLLLGKYYFENRVNADFEELSPYLLNALVATEDARFFEHKGVDFRAYIRVLFRTVLRGDNSGGGGSTISQQLAKNLFGRKTSGFFAIPIIKVKEMFTARRLEKTYTKEELLGLYLNTVPFGEDVYGVKVASKRFFNTNPSELTIEDAATLVGMLKANSYYNPVKHPERAIKRRNTVLTQMEKYEYIQKVELDSLKQLPIEVKYVKEGHNQGIATYFREHLRFELKEILKNYPKPNGDLYDLYTDGLKIHTTINSTFQKYAEEAVEQHLKTLQKDYNKNKSLAKATKLIQDLKKKSNRYKSLKKAGLSEKEIDKVFTTPVTTTLFSHNEGGTEEREISPLDSIKYYLSMLNAGFMVMQPQTGKMQAWVGGVDQKHFQYDHVKSKRQVGSTFKPLVYAEALRQGKQPCDYLFNRLVTYSEYDDWTPENSDGKYGGMYSMKGGLSNSVNSVTVNLIMNTGVDSVRTLAQKLGIKSDIPSVPSIALGTANISLQEMVQVYATFANKGKKPTPYYLTKIENSRGEIIVEFEKPNQEDFPQVLEEEDNAILTNILEAVVDTGTARRLRYRYHFENDIAGKTGTTQNQSDGWFMGYTPAFVAGAWVGAEYPVVHWKSLSLGQGANTALPIWGIFAQKLYADPRYGKLQRATFDPLSEDQLWDLDCPAYLESEELFVREGEEIEDENIDDLINDVLKDIFSKKDKSKPKQPRVNERPRSRPQQSESSKRINERNREMEKKRKKKKKRKKFFDKVLGREQ